MTTATAEAFTVSTHNGTITVTNPETGGHRTFRIHTQKWADRRNPDAEPELKRVAQLLSGPDNETDYTSFGFVRDDGSIRVWAKHRGTVYETYASMLMHAERWAERKGLEYEWAARCRRCNRTLTTPESLASGIGPICEGR